MASFNKALDMALRNRARSVHLRRDSWPITDYAYASRHEDKLVKRENSRWIDGWSPDQEDIFASDWEITLFD